MILRFSIPENPILPGRIFFQEDFEFPSIPIEMYWKCEKITYLQFTQRGETILFSYLNLLFEISNYSSLPSFKFVALTSSEIKCGQTKTLAFYS